MKSLRIICLILILSNLFVYSFAKNRSGKDERKLWVNTLSKIVEPVLNNTSKNTLRKNMPVEVVSAAKNNHREKVTHLEAVARVLSGISPWLELGEDKTDEGKLRKYYIDLSNKTLKNIVDPASPDCLNFTTDPQALVDAAFLAQSLLRAPTQLWGNLDAITQNRIIEALKSTRVIKPYESNWLLFSALIETTLMKYSGSCETKTIDYALKRFDEWYKGDAWYGDGKTFHFDYYNSIVIHPMLLDILTVLNNKQLIDSTVYNIKKTRSIRYAEELERMISPEGTYPAIGRSLAYRFGIFHILSQVALMKQLPTHIVPAQVRSALSLIIERQINAPGTFDKNGWLQLGFCGHQPEIAETYISTGSLYLCCEVFLPLGLPANDEFWTTNYTEWTNKKAWSGKNIKIDHAIKE